MLLIAATPENYDEDEQLHDDDEQQHQEILADESDQLWKLSQLQIQ
jgi:hypothetical protein